MTEAQTIRKLRATCSRLYDYCDRIETVSGLPFERTPLAQAVRGVLAETDPEADPQQTLEGTAA